VGLIDVRAEAAKLLDTNAAICERRQRRDSRLPRMPRNILKVEVGLDERRLLKRGADSRLV
jgi:hypothetical protein